jgi:hypothetical protein
MGTPLAGWKAVLAIPSYGPVDPQCQKDVRVAMMLASKYGLTWEADCSPDKVGWGHGRNMAAQSVLEMPDVTGLMWIDSDIRMPPNAIAKLLATAKKFNIEFMTGVYHQRGGYYTPVFYHWSESKRAFQPYKDYPEDSLYPIEGCGFGFVWTSRKLIRDVALLPKFDTKRGWFPDDRDSGGFGEDMNFCRQVMDAGHQLWVDTGIQLGHMGETEVITRESYIKKREETNWTPVKAKESEEAGRWGVKD